MNHPNPVRRIEASFLRSGYVIALCVETLFYIFMVLTGPMLNYTENIMSFTSLHCGKLLYSEWQQQVRFIWLLYNRPIKLIMQDKALTLRFKGTFF